MEIICPICSISIDVTEDHIGHKGRCPSCESKFIIPKTPDGEFEILHRGEVPDEVPKRRVALLQPSKAPVTRRRAPARLSHRPKSSASGIVPIAILCLVAVIGFTIWRNMNGGSSGGKREKAASWNKVTVGEEAIAAPEATAPSAVAAAPSPVPEIVGSEEPVAPAPAPAPDVVETTAPADEAPPALTEEQKANALIFLKSNQVEKRKTAYAGFRKLGSHEKAAYLEVLAEARDHHADLLSDRAWDLATGDKVLSNFKEAHDLWIVVREQAKEMVQTNWKSQDEGNYKKQHGEMDDISAKAIKLYARVVRSAKQAGGFEPAGLQPYADALAEIRGEIAWCDDRDPSAPLSLLDEISETGSAEDYVTTHNLVSAANQIAAAHDAAEEYNAGSAWASGAYKTFATTLNGRRVAFGLVPLRLDEMLSKGCGDHSADMAANGYFSHTGLTPETKTFGKRAKRAGFTGFATGECIFMGNSSANAAHQAWWYSDGHRLIMYANNPNTLGLGLHGKHWTLNTGKK